MINKFYQAADSLKSTMKLQPETATTSSRTTSGRSKAGSEKHSSQSQRDELIKTATKKTRANNKDGDIPSIPENQNLDAAALDLELELKMKKEKILCDTENYKARLYTVCDGIFGDFVENMLDLFDEIKN